MRFSVFGLQAAQHPANGPDSGARSLSVELLLERGEARR